MKHIPTMLVLSVAFASLVFAQAPKSKNDGAEKIIAQLEQEWIDAVVKADVAVFNRIEAPEWTLADSDGSLKTKAVADREVTSGDYKASALKIDELKVAVYGDTAVAQGLMTEKSTYKGKDTSGQSRF